VRNYEVSEVNEMLQGMERFNGIFVCTTNLFERIDEAALRRFSFKIRFLPLKPAQRVAMFVDEALDGDDTRMTDAIRRDLDAMDCLTPGDFATVKRQSVVLGEALTPDEFLAQLRQEHAVKPDVRHHKPVGFTQ
jgi:SpoVK/Ycf46/Vps4 family AAA+-type ATPase